MDVALVTGVTFERRMPCRQWHIGVACMIKLDRAPTGNHVAARAVATVAGFVHIVGAVTSITIAAAKIVKIAAAMTILAA